MDNVLELVRPKPTKVRIYGKEYEARKLRYPAMLRLVGSIASLLSVGGGEVLDRVRKNPGVVSLTDILLLLSEGTEEISKLLDLVFEETLPEFKEASELTVEDAAELFSMIWKLNEMEKALERFFGRRTEGSPQPLRQGAGT